MPPFAPSCDAKQRLVCGVFVASARTRFGRPWTGRSLNPRRPHRVLAFWVLTYSTAPYHAVFRPFDQRSNVRVHAAYTDFPMQSPPFIRHAPSRYCDLHLGAPFDKPLGGRPPIALDGSSSTRWSGQRDPHCLAWPTRRAAGGRSSAPPLAGARPVVVAAISLLAILVPRPPPRGAWSSATRCGGWRQRGSPACSPVSIGDRVATAVSTR